MGDDVCSKTVHQIFVLISIWRRDVQVAMYVKNVAKWKDNGTWHNQKGYGYEIIRAEKYKEGVLIRPQIYHVFRDV